MKKKATGVLLSLLMIVCLTGNSFAAEAEATIPEGTSNVLVVYFSHQGNSLFVGDPTDVDTRSSASVLRENGDNFVQQFIDGQPVGNTEVIAHYIAEYTGGTLFPIRVAELYPLDPYETLDVGQQQRADNARPELITHVENMNQYDTVYIGYPIWWGTFPMPVFTFLEEYDFTGKTMVPFSTHDGSGLGGGPRDIAELCPGATVVEGFTIRCSEVMGARETVNAFVDSVAADKQ